MEITGTKTIDKVARIGLIAKGVVYVILGIIGFMAAFEIGDQKNGDADTRGVFSTIEDLPGGFVLLIILAVGLACYTIWRLLQAWTIKESDAKKLWAQRIRYTFSGIAYGSLAYTAIRMILHLRSDDNDQNQQIAATLLEQSYGQWIAAVVAIAFACIGAYQIYYGIKEKYKKHTGSLHAGNSLLLKSAKVGYVSRGLVWLIVAYLFLRAAIYSKSSEAGNTGKAFEFIEASTFGSFLLGILSVGVIMYGFFNFIRARYERIDIDL